MPSFEVMTCLHFYQWGIEKPSAMGVCLPFFRYDGLSSVVIVVTPLTSIMKDQVLDILFALLDCFIIALLGNQPYLPTIMQ